MAERFAPRERVGSSRSTHSRRGSDAAPTPARVLRGVAQPIGRNGIVAFAVRVKLPVMAIIDTVDRTAADFGLTTLRQSARLRTEALSGLIAQLSQGSAVIAMILVVVRATGSVAAAGAVAAAFS